MRGHVLERRQTVSGDLATVFAFFEDPTNLEAITPPWLNFEIVWSSDTTVRRGTEFEYRLTWKHVPLRWRSRITEYAGGEYFADEMLRGPYAHWYHRHVFCTVPDGVEITDRVEYRLPFGPIGRVVHRLVVRPQLEAIFDYRSAVISRLFEDGRRHTPSV